MDVLKRFPETAWALIRHYAWKLWVRVAATGMFAFLPMDWAR
ncbi:hypothetical protein [uncultured Tateyamaria sp.]|nr:hypothetical protein [uncultured Tateyamaria sp.]